MIESLELHGITRYGIVGLGYMLRVIVLLTMNMFMMITMVRQMLAMIDADMARLLKNVKLR